MFSIIDRYISKLYLSFFFSGIVAIMTLFFVIDFMGNVARFDVPLSVFGRYYWYYGFEILYQIIPVASLVGVVFTLSLLNKRNELTSLFSFGMSLWRILLPLLLWVSLFTGISFYLGDQILPVAVNKGGYIYHVEMKKNPGSYSTIKADKIWYRVENSILNIKLLDAENSKAEKISIYYFTDDWKIQQIIEADEALINGSQWDLRNGTLTVMAEEQTVPLIKDFDQKIVSINSQIVDLQTTSSASEVLTFRELGQYIDRNREAGLNMTPFQVDYHKKLSFPFTTFVMSFLGIPFVIGHRRSGGIAKNIGIILLLTIAFQVTYSLSLSMGKHGSLYPVVSAWGPNLLMLGLSILLFRKKG